MVTTIKKVEIPSTLKDIYNFDSAATQKFCEENNILGFQTAIEESIGVMPLEFYQLIVWFHNLPDQTPKFIGKQDKMEFEKEFGENSHLVYDAILHAIVKAQAVYNEIITLTAKHFNWVFMHLGCDCGCCKIIVTPDYKPLQVSMTKEYKWDSFYKNLEEDISKVVTA